MPNNTIIPLKRRLLKKHDKFEDVEIENITIEDIIKKIVDLHGPAAKVEINDNKAACVECSVKCREIEKMVRMFRERVTRIRKDIEKQRKNNKNL